MRISDWSSDVCSSDLRYFFMDVAKDGIALYEFDDKELHKPKPKTPEQALDMAQEYFDEWFPSAMKRFEISKFDLEKGYLKDAAFDTHQATERLYQCVLLVCTFYTDRKSTRLNSSP